MELKASAAAKHRGDDRVCFPFVLGRAVMDGGGTEGGTEVDLIGPDW